MKAIPDCVVYNKLDIYVFIMIAYSEIDDTFPHKYTPYSIFYDVTEVLSLVKKWLKLLQYNKMIWILAEIKLCGNQQ
jgi:hypothetical protein